MDIFLKLCTNTTGVVRKNPQTGGGFISASFSWKQQVKTTPNLLLFRKLSCFLNIGKKEGNGCRFYYG